MALHQIDIFHKCCLTLSLPFHVSPQTPATLAKLHYAPILLEAQGPRPVMLSRTSPSLCCHSILYTPLKPPTAQHCQSVVPLATSSCKPGESGLYSVAIESRISALTPLSISFLRLFPLWSHLHAGTPGSLVMLCYFQKTVTKVAIYYSPMYKMLGCYLT